MVATTTYSYQNVQAVLDGLGITGTFDGDDVIEVAPGADVGTMLIGAGGDGIFSGSADRSAMITIRLQHTSPTHRQLTQKWLQQRAGRYLPFPFSFTDADSNEGGTADRCLIQTAPTQSNGTAATVREWVLVTAEYIPNVPNP